MERRSACNTKPRFGDIYYANLNSTGSVQGGKRPVLIIQNDKGNRYSTTTEVLPFTSQIRKASYMPTHIVVRPSSDNGLTCVSVVLGEQALTVNMDCLLQKLGRLEHETLIRVGAAREIQCPFPKE